MATSGGGRAARRVTQPVLGSSSQAEPVLAAFPESASTLTISSRVTVPAPAPFHRGRRPFPGNSYSLTRRQEKQGNESATVGRLIVSVPCGGRDVVGQCIGHCRAVRHGGSGESPASPLAVTRLVSPYTPLGPLSLAYLSPIPPLSRHRSKALFLSPVPFPPCCPQPHTQILVSDR